MFPKPSKAWMSQDAPASRSRRLGCACSDSLVVLFGLELVFSGNEIDEAAFCKMDHCVE